MNVIFPTTPKIQYVYEKVPTFNTLIKRSAGRKEYRATYWPTAPLWEISIPLNGMSSEEMMVIGGFVALVRGALHDFYFRDAAPVIEGEQSVQGIYNTKYSVSHELANVGNGLQSQWQLFRNWNWWFLEYPRFPPFTPTGYGVGGQELPFDESGVDSNIEGYGVPIWETPYIYFNAVLQDSGYTIDQYGLVSFDNAPPAGTILTADFGFYYKCRLKEDYARLQKIAPEVWSTTETIVLVTVDD